MITNRQLALRENVFGDFQLFNCQLLPNNLIFKRISASPVSALLLM